MMRSKNRGFTIVELMLAVMFISLLLLSIAMLALQVGSIYQRGMTLRSINQSGRDLSDMLRRDFLQSQSRDIYVENAAAAPPQLVVEDRYGGGPVASGRICLGSVSYLWNTPRGMTHINNMTIKFADGKPVNLVRVYDREKKYCTKDRNKGRPNQLVEGADYMQVLQSKSDTAKGEVLALHDMRVEELATTKDNKSDIAAESLYRIKFTLGTSKESEIEGTVASGKKCKPPADNESNYEYCAINTFEMIVRANGGKGE